MKDDHDKFAINIGQMTKLPHKKNLKIQFQLTHSNNVCLKINYHT
jgi:hypothetical protein